MALRGSRLAEDTLRHKEDDLPMYRYYGIKKKVYPKWEKIKLIALRIVLIFVMIPLFIAPFMIVTAFYLFFPELWIKVLVTVIAFIFISLKLTRTRRKRSKFCKNLKKVCNDKKYRLNFERKGASTFKFAKEGVDFTVDTGRQIYYVRYLTMRKYNASIYFEGKDKIKLVKHHLNNKFTIIFDLKSKNDYIDLDFTVKERDDRKSVKVILVNPTCKEMFFKDHDGSRVATGSGAEIFGYTVYTGSGFIEAIQRENSNRYKYE